MIIGHQADTAPTETEAEDLKVFDAANRARAKDHQRAWGKSRNARAWDLIELGQSTQSNPVSISERPDHRADGQRANQDGRDDQDYRRGHVVDQNDPKN